MDFLHFSDAGVKLRCVTLCFGVTLSVQPLSSLRHSFSVWHLLAFEPDGRWIVSHWDLGWQRWCHVCVSAFMVCSTPHLWQMTWSLRKIPPDRCESKVWNVTINSKTLQMGAVFQEADAPLESGAESSALQLNCASSRPVSSFRLPVSSRSRVQQETAAGRQLWVSLWQRGGFAAHVLLFFFFYLHLSIKCNKVIVFCSNSPGKALHHSQHM